MKNISFLSEKRLGKYSITRFLSVIALIAVIFISSIAKAEAQLIVAEPFNYTLNATDPDPDGGGTINGGNGLPATNVGGNPTGTSVGLRGNYGTMHTVVEGLTYSNSGGTLVTSANALKRTDGSSYGTEAWIYRNMTTDPFNDYRATWSTNWLGFRTGRSNELYFSMLINANAVNTATYNRFVMYIGFNGGANYATFIGQPNGNNKWVYADQAGVSKDLGTATANKTEFIVGKLSYPNATSYSIALWFNPTLGQALGTPTVTQGYPIDGSTWTNGADFRGITTRDGVNILTYDEFRMGLTAADVMPCTIITNSASSNISAYNLSGQSSVTVASGNELVIDQNTTLAGITVAAGGKLTIQSGKTLSAPVTIESSATGTGTLVDENTAPTINATINQYLPTGRNWYVGMPINSTTTPYTALTAAGAASVSHWDETIGDWVHNYTGNLNRGKGYIAVSAIGTATNNISFTGTLNAGDVEVALTRTAGKTKEGFNLISNPYPSYLNAMTAINAKSAKMETTIWYRTKGSTYTFETVNTASGEGTNGVTGYIPPMQAFWVRVKPNANPASNNSETLTFTNAMRYHANPTIGETTITTTPLKAPKSETQRIRLQITNGTNTDEAVIYTHIDAANGFDKFDSRKWSNDNVAIPEIFTVTDEENLVINGYNTLPVNQEILMGFKTGEANNFVLRVSELKIADSSVRTVLIDKLLNTETILSDGTEYSFSSGAVNTTDRFTLIFRSSGTVTAVTSAGNNESLKVFTSNRQIVVSGAATGTEISVFNTLGQRMLTQTIRAENTRLNRALAPGMYLFSVDNVTRKIIIE